MSEHALDFDPEIKVLRAKQRDSMAEDWITKYDKVNDDGDKIEEVPFRSSSNTFDVNMSNLFGPAPSTTGDVDLIVLEAEMKSEGREMENPHIPINERVLDKATERLAQADLTPAWDND